MDNAGIVTLASSIGVDGAWCWEMVSCVKAHDASSVVVAASLAALVASFVERVASCAKENASFWWMESVIVVWQASFVKLNVSIALASNCGGGLDSGRGRVQVCVTCQSGRVGMMRKMTVHVPGSGQPVARDAASLSGTRRR